jgi:hypothetical protein
MAILTFSGFASAQSKQKVALQTGETKSVMGSRLNVKFLSVLDDSRCPKGTTCIWAGNARVSIRVWKKNGKSVDFELNSNLDPRSIEFAGYKVAFAGLSPRTQDGSTASVILEISKLDT